MHAHQTLPELSAPADHAGSSTHLAVLTSDSAWQLYHAADFSLPEQRFMLRLQPRRWPAFLGMLIRARVIKSSAQSVPCSQW